MAQQQRILGELTVTMTGTSSDAVTLETELGSSYNNQVGVDVYIYNTGANIMYACRSTTSTKGIPIPASDGIVLENHVIADDKLYLRGTASDVAEVAIYGPAGSAI